MRFTTLISSFTLSLLLRPAPSQPDSEPLLQPLLGSPNEYSPFLAPRQPQSRGGLVFLSKRQNSCPANHSSCSSLNAPNACCPNDTLCARDGAGNIACCPRNYACTGVLSGSGSTTSQATGTSNTAVIIGGTITVTSTAGVTATPTQTTGVNAPVTITAGSTVPNNYYPFPYIQTTYANSIACLSAYSYCQSQSATCFASLAGQNGVTVSNALGGGGVTVAGVTGLAQSSASSVCSSLSLTACYGLQSSQCSSFGAGVSSTGGAVQVGNNVAGRGCDGKGYVAGIGLGAAVAWGIAV